MDINSLDLGLVLDTHWMLRTLQVHNRYTKKIVSVIDLYIYEDQNNPKVFSEEIDLGVDIDGWVSNDKNCSRDRMAGEGNDRIL